MALELAKQLRKSLALRDMSNANSACLHFIHRFSRKTSQNSSRRSSQQSNDNEVTPIKVQPTQLIETETSATEGVDFGVYLRYFKHIGVPFSITILLFNILHESVSVGSNYWLTIWSTDPRAGEDTFWRNLYVGVYGGLGFFQGDYHLTNFLLLHENFLLKPSQFLLERFPLPSVL